MRILGIIPARGGSKGVPRKNIKILGGKPLIVYTIESALNANGLTDIIVSTDSEEIAIISKKHGATVPFLRPKKLATDSANSIDVVIHVLEEQQKRNKFYDAVVLLQPTTPFRPIGFIDLCINQFLEMECDSLVSVLPVPHEYNPHWAFKCDKRGFLNIATGEGEIISRRQDLPLAYHRDGSVYITKTEIIQNKKSFFGESLGYFVGDQTMYVNIDNIHDWDKAKLLIKERGLI